MAGGCPLQNGSKTGNCEDCAQVVHNCVLLEILRKVRGLEVRLEIVQNQLKH